jgi:hypothetical protein
MQPTSTHGAHGRSGDPARPPSPQSQGDQVGATSSRRRVRSRSPEVRQEPASFHGFTNSQQLSVLASPVASPSLTDRDAEPLPQQQDPFNAETSPFQAPEGGPVRKAARRVRSSVVLPPLTTPQQPRSSGHGIGFVYGAAPANRGENKSQAVQVSAPVLRPGPIASGVTFRVSADALAALSSTSSRPLVVKGSVSDGSFLVAYADLPAPQPAPAQPVANRLGPDAPAERELDGKGHAPALQPPAPQADQEQAPAPRHTPIDPVNSRVAKLLRSRLRSALLNGQDDHTIYKNNLRQSAGAWEHLKHQRLAFTPEFLVAVLLALPSLEIDGAITCLGRAVGRLRVPSRTIRGSGTLGAQARHVIGEALGHAAVQARVPLGKMLTFLQGADEQGSVARPDQRPRRQFTQHGAPYGIPQALARRLAREAQAAAPGDLQAALAAAEQLGKVLSKDTQKRQATLNAVTSEIDAADLPAAVKAQLKDRFQPEFQLPTTQDDVANMSDDAPAEA